MTATAHNELGLSELSPFTSWTREPGRARWFAQRHGPGGVVLRVAEGAPAAQEGWYWDMSPDEFGEDEVLLHGIRLGVEVFEV